MNLDLKLTLNVDKLDTQEVKERVKRTHDDVKTSNMTPLEQLEHLKQSVKLNEKDLVLFNLAHEGIKNGEVFLKKEGKLTKAYVLQLGREVEEKRGQQARIERARKVIETKPKNFYIIRDDKHLSGFMNRLREECLLQRKHWPGRWKDLGVESLTVWDYEGTGIDPFLDLTIGVSVWLPYLNEGYYLPYGHVWGIDEVNGTPIPTMLQHTQSDRQLTRSKVIEAIKPFMEAPTEGKSFHMSSARYDLHIVKNDGYEIRGAVFDSANAMYLLNEHEESYALKKLTQKYGEHFGIKSEVFTFEDLFGNCSPAPFNTELVGIYAINDVKYGWFLTEWQIKMMQQTDNLWKCYSMVDSKLPETDAYLFQSGFDIDLDKMAGLEEKFAAELEEAEKQLLTDFGIDEKWLYDMNMTIQGDKIQEWIKKQQQKAEKLKERIEKQKETIRDCEEQGKTHLKKYKTAKENLIKYQKELNELGTPTAQDCPHYFHEFSLTNNRHVAYLVYDFLQIPDATGRLKPGKERAVSKDVLEVYMKDHDSLKPLKKVSELEKLLGTYVRKIPRALDPDGKLRARFDSTGTATGRYSSSAYKARSIDVLDDIKKITGE
jgi:DNA polymerase I